MCCLIAQRCHRRSCPAAWKLRLKTVSQLPSGIGNAESIVSAQQAMALDSVLNLACLAWSWLHVTIGATQRA